MKQSEMNNIIHTKVMKKKDVDCDYTTDITRVWDVVYEVSKICFFKLSNRTNGYNCILSLKSNNNIFMGNGSTIPLAICEAIANMAEEIY